MGGKVPKNDTSINSQPRDTICDNTFIALSSRPCRSVFGHAAHRNDGDQILHEYPASFLVNGEQFGNASILFGPFNSTGGFDWWYLSFTWGLNLTPGTSIGVTWIASYPVQRTALGGLAPLLYPPIHVHHLAMSGSDSPSAEAFEESAEAFEEFVGDSQCSASRSLVESPRSMQCLEKDYFGYAKLIRTPIFARGLYNDVRPEGAKLLSWYLLVGINVHTRPLSEYKLLSYFGVKNAILPHTQLKPKNFVLIPTSFDSVQINRWRMPYSGSLVPALVWVHTHSLYFKKSWLYAGFSRRLFQHLPSDYCGRLVELCPGSNYTLESSQLEAAHDLICTAEVSMANISSVLYDRESVVRCRDWTFFRNDVITSISLFGMHLNYKAARGYFPMHHYWYLHYVSEDKASHYATPDGSPERCREIQQGPNSITLRELAHIVIEHGNMLTSLICLTIFLSKSVQRIYIL